MADRTLSFLVYGNYSPRLLSKPVADPETSEAGEGTKKLLFIRQEGGSYGEILLAIGYKKQHPSQVQLLLMHVGK